MSRDLPAYVSFFFRPFLSLSLSLFLSSLERFLLDSSTMLLLDFLRLINVVPTWSWNFKEIPSYVTSLRIYVVLNESLPFFGLQQPLQR